MARNRGFTLAEIILSATLLSTVMLMLLNLLPAALFSIRQAEHRILAMAQAQSLLETFRSQAFDSLPVCSAQKLVANEVHGDDGVVYTPLLSVGPVSLANATRLHFVRVAVQWHERNGTHEVVRETWICKISH